ncbi:MAG TPA: hypothetical protein VFW35_10280, partial [Sphingomicrobium sp.]|nr:hypothetical protein [Sphingomicrobium sp.]
MAVAYWGVSTSEGRRRWRLPERLPDLKGKWLTFYMIVWAIMLPLAIIGPVRSAHVLQGYMAKPAWAPYGIEIVSGTDELLVSAPYTEEARQAGVHRYDRIVEIDDWKVSQSAAAATDARLHLRKPEGASTVFKLIGKDGGVRQVRLTFSRRHIEEPFRGSGISLGSAVAIQIGGSLLNCLGFVAAAVLLFVRQRRQAVPALLSLGFVMASASLFGADWSDLGVSNTLVNFIGALAFCLLFAALLAFPDGRFFPRWVQIAVLALPILLIVAAANASPSVLLSAIGGFLVLAVFALISRYRRLSPGPMLQQMRWVFLGFLGGMALFILNIVGNLTAGQLQLVDARWYAWGFLPPFLGDVGSLLIAVGLMVSVLKYRLYDADAVIGRSAAYGILTIGFVGLFAGSEKLAELIGERYFAHSIGIAAGAVGAAVAAACIVPLHNRVHRWAERRFQKPLIRLREGLPECVADLRESAPVEQLVAAVMTRIEAGVRSTREAMLLTDKGRLEVAGKR